MEDGPPTGGLSPEELARLLSIGVEDDGSDAQESSAGPAAELLDAMLAGPLPPVPTMVDALPTVLARLRRDLLPLGGRSIGEILSDPDMDLPALSMVKVYGKRIAAGNPSGPKHAAAVAVYYAAIAAALIRHGERITTHSPSYLKASLRELSNAPWVGEKLSSLLATAAEACDAPKAGDSSPK